MPRKKWAPEVELNYRKRIVDDQLKDLLAIAGFVVIEGPKAVGKTATARQAATSIVALDTDLDARNLATISPEVLLKKTTPLLIDEWQLVPQLWSHVKREVDSRQVRGQFILTGSSVPIDEITRDSAAGRVARIKMRPMSLFESEAKHGKVSLQALFDDIFTPSSHSKVTLEDIVNSICRGGWPSNLELSVHQAQLMMTAYVNELTSVDLQRISGIKFNKLNLIRVLKSVARNVGTKASDITIGKDAVPNGNPIDRKLVANYLESLERAMVLEPNPAWTPALRSRDRLIGSPTHYFVDPAVAVAVMGTSPKALLSGEIKFLGFLFENLVIRDLRIYMQSMNGTVKQYRDSAGLEVDAIIENSTNQWAAIEVKLGVNQIDSAAENLLKFSKKIDTEYCGNPAFMAVVTATGSAYRRADGIYIIPISSLAP